jgi:thiamine-phosphate pyrophosphorylase
MTPRERLATARLYLVTPARPRAWIEAAIRGGVDLIQLRDKTLDDDGIIEAARAFRDTDALFILNDRPDLVEACGADGVHVGQDDLPPAAVRSLAGEEAIVGLSTHTVEQLDRAVNEPVSYVAIGPVFGTSTKVTGHERVGLAMVREAARRTSARAIPLVAIGGITLESAPSVLAAGAASVAVIGDLLRAGDPATRVKAFLSVLSPNP